MQTDSLLDSHVSRLSNDPGYQAVWHFVQSVPENLRLLASMKVWADNVEVLRLVVEHLKREEAA